jgi:predicted RND superfamily exporter protein
MRRYFEFVLSNQRLVWLVLLLLSLLSVASTTRAILGSTLQDLFFGDAPEYADYIERARQFSNDELVFIGIEDDDPLHGDRLDALEVAIERMEADPDIARVQSLLTAQRVVTGDLDLEIMTYADAARDRPEERASLQQELVDDPLHGGMLMASDGQSHTLIVELSVDPDRNPEQRPDLVPEMIKALEEAGFEREAIHVTGLPRLLMALLTESYGTLTGIFPVSVIVMVGLVLGIFRRMAPVAVATGVSLLAVLWTMGFATELERNHSIMSTIIPVVVMVVAVSDVIHLWNAYLEELRAGRSKREAILESATDVGRACMWTSVTTFVGFVCLSLVPTPVFRLMGVVLGFGVAIALLLAMTLVPMILSRLAVPELRSLEQEHRLERGIRWLVDLCAQTSTRHPRSVLVVFGIFLVWTGIGLSRFEIETRFRDRLHEETEYRQDASWFDQRFHGTQSLEVFIDAPEPEGLLKAERVARIDAFERRVREMPEVDGVFSYLLLLEQMMPAFDPTNRLPQTDPAVAQLMETASWGGEERLEAMINFERNSMRSGVRLNVEGIREIHRLGVEIEEIGAEELGDMNVEATGIISLVGWWVDAILEGQKNGLLLSITLITLMMIIALRSVRAGLLSMVPNLLPLLSVGAVLGWTTDGVDSDALIIGMLAIGIGVDDTIHFLVRYRIEALRCETRAQAVRRTFDFAGRAILITTLILCMGFLPFLLSNYLSLWYFGTLLPLALVVALLADLLWVPALAQLGIFAFQPVSN